MTASIFSDLSCLFLAWWPSSINNSSINQHEEQQPTNKLKLKQELFLFFFFGVYEDGLFESGFNGFLPGKTVVWVQFLQFSKLE